MQTVYEALNSLEGSMIQHLLDAEGISAHLSGAYLEGGAGELQAGSVVRVMVEAEDLARAREIVRDWEARQPATDEETSPRDPSPQAFVAGLVLGALCMYLFLA